MNHLKLHPYRFQLTHELQIGDHQKRDFLQLTSEDFNLLLIMSDEAHFYLTGHINKHNCRYRSADNRRIIDEQTLRPQKVTVWCGMTCERYICHYFFRLITDELLLLREILTGNASRNIYCQSWKIRTCMMCGFSEMEQLK